MFSRSSRSPAVTKSSTLYYPIYLSYATGVLEKEGFDVRLIDAPASDYERDDVLRIVADFQPDLTVVDTSTPSIYNDVEVAEAIKSVCNTFLVMVGTHVSALPEETLMLSNKIDAVARHEYELILKEVAEKIRDGEDFKTVNGLSYLKNGQVVHNKDMPFIEDLDSLPFVSSVYKKHLSNHYHSYFYGANLHPIIVILSARGCPYRCIYCLYPQVMTGHRYRLRSPVNFVDEMEYIKENFKDVKEIFIEDDTMSINKEHLKGICNEIIKRKLNITWSTNSRADIDSDILLLMKEAGCRELCVGFESGDQGVLDNIGKKIKVDQFYEFMKGAKKAGIIIHGCFLVGNPGETKETMAKTLKLSLKLNPDTVQFYPLMVYPGTKAYKWAEDNDYLATKEYDKWLTPQGLHNSVVERDNLSNDELVQWCNKARRKFYLRPRYILSKVRQIIKSPNETKRIFMAAGSLVKYLFRR